MAYYIIKIDNLKSCRDCPCFYETEGMFADECQLAGKYHPNESDFGGARDIPEWCPLIKMREDFVVKHHRAHLLGKKSVFVVFDELGT